MNTRRAALDLMVAALGILVDKAPIGPHAPRPGSPEDYILAERMGMKDKRPSKETRERAARLIMEQMDAARALYRKSRTRQPAKKQAGRDLAWLMDELAANIDQLTARLEAGEITAADWSAEFERLLARYHTAGLMAGQTSGEVDRRGAEYLARLVGEQYEYLANFRVEIVDAAEWQAAFNARAESYAAAIKVPYWTGDTQFLPLPAMPAEGTTCLCITDPMVRVLTGRGEIPIADVVPGDLVLTHRMRWRPVLRTIVNSSLPGHRQVHLRISGRRPVGCTSDHRWMTEEGWRSAIDIHSRQLRVYNGSHEGMRCLRHSPRQQEQRFSLRDVPISLVLPLWATERLASPRVRCLRQKSQGEGAVAESLYPPEDAWGIASGGDRAPCAIRWPRAGAMAGQAGRTALDMVLVGGRLRQEGNLPLSMDLDYGQWSHSARDGSSPQERGTFGRSVEQSPTDVAGRPSAPSHDGRSQAPNDPGKRPYRRGQDPSLLSLPQGLSFQTVEPEILLEGLLSPGTPLYDLEVAQDHSFILEGTISHNSNCGCAWRIETLDAENGDYDCFWERSKEDSCQVCIQREHDWHPIGIRNWELQV